MKGKMGGLLGGGGVRGGGAAVGAPGGARNKVAKVGKRISLIAWSCAYPAQADWSEGLRKKKSAGVSDLTLLSTITNDEINNNLKMRFTNQEIYVSGHRSPCSQLTSSRHISLMCSSPSILSEVGGYGTTSAPTELPRPGNIHSRDP